VPAALAAVVSAVAGLDTRPRLRPAVPPGVVGGALTPAGARQAYDINPLFTAGIQGQGQRIATVSFGDLFSPSDVTSFDQQFGLPQTLPKVVPVNEPTPCCVTNNPSGTGEADLDAELAHATAPRAQIFAINTPPGSNGNILPLGGALNAIAGRHLVDIVSVSYGVCELAQSPADLQSDNNALQTAVSTGIMVFVSTGDAGAYSCQRNISATDHRLSVQYPSSSPFVVAVGGTALAVGPDGSYLGENAWVDTLSQGGGGGGLSAVFARPSWQTGVPGVQNQFSNGMRQLPDVSADADPLNSPWANFGPVPTPNGAQSALTGAGGTSAATPFWAGVMALVRQYAQQQGHGQLGPVPALLYQVGGTSFANTPFHDVTVGTNRFYPATQGWDFATGLGSPDVFNLAQDVVSFLKQNGH
jgi:kumamolisin